jgi:hypothetical protein
MDDIAELRKKVQLLTEENKRLKYRIKMSELEEDIKHCEEVLADWHGCDECRADHERLLSYMKELLEYRKVLCQIRNTTR